MNSRNLIVGTISIVVLGAFVFMGNKNKENEVRGVQSQTISTDQTKNKVAHESHTKTMGAVDVEVTPVKLEPGQNMVFELSFNTHSVDLSYDYTKIITIQDDKGNTYKALNWSGGNSGHHLNGDVELELLLEGVRSIKFNINGVDNQNAVFEWDL